jgi:hypothetical protein
MKRLALMTVVATLAFKFPAAYGGEMLPRVVIHGHFGDAVDEFGYDGIERLAELEDGPMVPVVTCYTVSEKQILLVDSPRHEIKIYTKDGVYQRSLSTDSISGTSPRFVVMSMVAEGQSIYLLEDRYAGVRVTPEITGTRFVLHRFDTESKVIDHYDILDAADLGTVPPTEYGPRQPIVGSVELYVSAGKVALYDRANRMTYLVGSAPDGDYRRISGWLLGTAIIEREKDDILTIEAKGRSSVKIGTGGVESVSPDGRYFTVVNYGVLTVFDLDGNPLGSFGKPGRNRGGYEAVHQAFQIVSEGGNAEVYECNVNSDGVFVFCWDTSGVR